MNEYRTVLINGRAQTESPTQQLARSIFEWWKDRQKRHKWNYALDPNKDSIPKQFRIPKNVRLLIQKMVDQELYIENTRQNSVPPKVLG